MSREDFCFSRKGMRMRRQIMFLAKSVIAVVMFILYRSPGVCESCRPPGQLRGSACSSCSSACWLFPLDFATNWHGGDGRFNIVKWGYGYGSGIGDSIWSTADQFQYAYQSLHDPKTAIWRLVADVHPVDPVIG